MIINKLKGGQMENSTKIWLGIIALAVIVLILIGTLTGNIVKRDKVTVGVILPMTGEVAAIGLNSKAAMELAAKEINENGGINGQELELIFEDGKCNSKDAANAANKLINIDGVDIIIGGMCSGETMSAAPIAESSETVLLSFCSSAPTVTNAGDYVFRVMPSDSYQGKFAAEYAYNELGARKVAVIYPLGDYGVGIKNAFTKNFEALGGEIVIEQGVEQTTKDLRTPLTKIKAENPDVIYFVAYADAAIIGLKQIKELGIKAQILGGDAWDDPKIIEEAKDSAEGVRYVMPYAPLNLNFKKGMKEMTNSEEITLCSPNGYDAVNLLAKIIAEVGTDSNAVKDALYQVEGYKGVSGTITIDENGDLEDATYQVKEIRNGKAEQIK